MKKSLLITALILLSGCVQPLEIKTDWDDRPVVVHCVLNCSRYEEKPLQKLELFYAAAAGDESFQPVQEAEINIHREGSRFMYTFTYQGDGVWTSEFSPSYGQKYYLEVKIPGRETITAETTTPECIQFWREATFGLSNYGSRWKEEKYEQYMNAFQKAGLVPPDKEMGGRFIGFFRTLDYNHLEISHDLYVWIRHSRGCDLATDHTYADDCNVTSRLYSADLFSPEDLSDTRMLDVKNIVPCCYGLPLHKGFLRIVNPVDYSRGFPNRYGHFDGIEAKVYPGFDKAFMIVGDFTCVPRYEDKGDNYLEMRFVSEELDKYYRDVYSFMSTNMDNIFNMVYSSSENMSSNIKNGLGVFGAEELLNVHLNWPFT